MGNLCDELLLYGKTYAGNTPGFDSGRLCANKVNTGLAGKLLIDQCDGLLSLKHCFFRETEDNHGILGVIGPALSLDDTTHGCSPDQVVILHETTRL